MIHINLMSGKSNRISDARARMLIAQKFESLGYADNPYEMNCGVKRCLWVRFRMEALSGKTTEELEMDYPFKMDDKWKEGFVKMLLKIMRE